MYKTIYHNLIKNEEYVNNMIKGLYEADIKIKTNYIDPKKEYDEVIKKRFKEQRAKLERIK